MEQRQLRKQWKTLMGNEENSNIQSEIEVLFEELDSFEKEKKQLIEELNEKQSFCEKLEQQLEHVKEEYQTAQIQYEEKKQRLSEDLREEYREEISDEDFQRMMEWLKEEDKVSLDDTREHLEECLKKTENHISGFISKKEEEMERIEKIILSPS